MLGDFRGKWMLRKLVMAMVLVALTSIQGVYALGLGEIDLRSALNQPLDATIEVLSSRPGELNAAEVAIASQQAFDRAGIERMSLLLGLDFTIEGVESGQPSIKVTSKDGIDEPFLNFLVEVNWSNGRLLREYTLLLDPPSLMPEPAPVVEAPSVEAPATTEPAAIEEVVATPIAAEPVMDSSVSEYGPTKSRETLWEIANKVRPDSSVSIHQMMQVLLRENPDAFYRNNINNLKVGYVLRVPDREAIAAISSEEARAATRRQTEAWREGRAVTARPTPTVATETETDAVAESDDSGRLKIVAPASDSSTADTSAPGAEAGKVVPGDVEGLKRELNLLSETSEAQRQDNEELRARLAELEKQLEMANRLLELKDDEMAALQANAATEVVEPEVVAPVEAEAPVVAEPAPAPVEVEVVEEPVVVKPEPMDDGEELDMLEQALELVDEAMDEPIILGGAAAVVVLLIVVIWLASRRRRMGMTEFQESILAASPKPTGFTDMSDDKSPSEDQQSESAEQTNLSDFGSISGMGDIQTEVSEVDPIAEADVYIAYGRFQQAEDMLKEAVDNESERNDLKLKLLEVYKATKNSKAFENDAEALYASLGGQADPIWDKVVAMGAELGIDNPIFGAGSAPSTDELSAELSQIMAGDGGSDELDTDLSSAETDSILGGDEDFGLDLDLGDMEPPEEPPAAESAEAEDEFSLGEFTLDEAAADSGVEGGAEPEADAEPEAELEFSLDLEEESVDEAPVAEPEIDISDLGEISFDTVTEETHVAEGELDSGEFDLGSFELPEEESAPELESADLSLDSADIPSIGDLGDLGDLGDNETEIEESIEDDELMGGLDEVGTKLDLAKAYMDMGDPDGARSILNEVMEEGSDAQKGEAEALLQQLG